MKKALPDKIHIIGSVGSGKTTLARKLSKKYNIQYYELDNVVWERHKSGDIRRADEDRDKYLEQIVSTKRWIIEGVHSQHWVGTSFKNADLIIFLDTPYFVRAFRIINRYVRQLIGVESANYTPSFKIFKDMFRWNRAFEKESKPKILKMIQEDKSISIIVKDNLEIDKYFN